MKTRVHVVISGRVQGVFFRTSTGEKAEELGLTGWARNTPDGNVEAVFEGEEGAVEEMLAWCQKGPTLAQVTKVTTTTEPFTGEFTKFSIRIK